MSIALYSPYIYNIARSIVELSKIETFGSKEVRELEHNAYKSNERDEFGSYEGLAFASIPRSVSTRISMARIGRLMWPIQQGIRRDASWIYARRKQMRSIHSTDSPPIFSNLRHAHLGCE